MYVEFTSILPETSQVSITDESYKVADPVTFNFVIVHSKIDSLPSTVKSSIAEFTTTAGVSPLSIRIGVFTKLQFTIAAKPFTVILQSSKRTSFKLEDSVSKIFAFLIIVLRLHSP